MRGLAGFLLVAALHASVASAQPSAVPGELNKALDVAYPGWRLARSDAVANARQWLRGDFDGDGRAEYAIQIVKSAQEPGVPDDERQVVVVAWPPRGGRSQRFEFTIVHTGAVSDLVYLALARRGERVPDLDADENGTRTYRLAHDGIHVLYGEVAGTTCQLMPTVTPRRFVCRTSGD